MHPPWQRAGSADALMCVVYIHAAKAMQLQDYLRMSALYPQPREAREEG